MLATSLRVSDFAANHLLFLVPLFLPTGLLFGLLCFRALVAHVFVLSGVVYIMLLLDPARKNCQTWIAYFSVAYLVSCHIYRQYYYFGLYLLDVTGPLMILVEKLSSLGYSLHDAKFPQIIEPGSKQKEYVLRKTLAVADTPSVLEYFGHVFFFPAFLAGPLHFYSQYKDFIEGKTPTKGSFVAAILNFFLAFVCMGVNKLPAYFHYDSRYAHCSQFPTAFYVHSTSIILIICIKFM